MYNFRDQILKVQFPFCSPSSHFCIHKFQRTLHERTQRQRRGVKMGDIADAINEVFSLQSSVFKAIGKGE